MPSAQLAASPIPGPMRRAKEAQRASSYLFAFAILTISWRVARPGLVNLTISDLALVACFLMLLARNQINPLPFGRMTGVWIFGLASMLGGLLFGNLMQGNPVRWLVVASQYIFAFVLVPVVCMGQSRDWLKRCAVYFVVGVTISQMVGIVARAFLPDLSIWGVFGHGFITGNGRVGALAGEPNPNGASCAFGMAFLIYALRVRAISRIGALICGAIILTGLLFSASFSGFASTLLVLAIGLATSGFKFAARLLIPALLLGTTFHLVGGQLPAAFEERVGEAVLSGDMDKAGTFTSRTLLVEEAASLVDDTLFVGFGADGYRKQSAYGQPVHNLHLLILTEGGMVAYLGLLTMLLVLGFSALAVSRINRADGMLALSVLGVFFICTFASPHMYTRNWVAPVFLALACALPRLPATRHKYLGNAAFMKSYGPPARARSQDHRLHEQQ